MADVTPIKTPAEQALSAAFTTARETLPGKKLVRDLVTDLEHEYPSAAACLI